ncbi:MAG: heavy metal response regulator transcription factor [Planctomycetaceae bacterium]|nr:heavy metal response regulator transcription factor [Planctomycetota bacterium]NUN52169.1 heavy metal response regulator transcription factor [Planctomycetaceae bacterium]
MKLLIVEDDPKTSAYLRKGLGESGFVVDASADGEDGLHMARTGGYDLVVLDLLLPGRDGWSVLQALRADGSEVPILVLTARDEVEDRVRGLGLGADDYLVKPFAFSELLARIRSVLRRGPQRSHEEIRVGDLEIDLARQVARRAGQRLLLTQKEFTLLSVLARRRGEVLSRSLIAEQVWDMNFLCDSNVVDVHIRRLRAKVDDPFDHPLVHTVRGSGYVLDERP